MKQSCLHGRFERKDNVWRRFLKTQGRRVQKNYLREKGIQLSDGGKVKRKAELLDLCEKAAAIRRRKLDDSAKDKNKLSSSFNLKNRRQS